MSSSDAYCTRLKVQKDDRDPRPMKGVADDLALQLASYIAAAIAVRAAGGWAMDFLMKFNMGFHKSLELARATVLPVRRTLQD